MNNSQQVCKSHYDFSKYAFEGRFVSYYWQLKETLALSPQSILEVGVGDRVFGSFIKQNTNVSYTSVDVAKDLNPDVVGSVLELPFVDKSFDVTCAFEVLEHLPFEDFDKAVSELCRVARTHVVISIPHFGPMFSFSLKNSILATDIFFSENPIPKETRLQRSALLGALQAWVPSATYTRYAFYARENHSQFCAVRQSVPSFLCY
ncbi:MAG TPA: class I SAM-dependent methyltransferase [Candidatus Paceibacterota bacterium]